MGFSLFHFRNLCILTTSPFFIYGFSLFFFSTICAYTLPACCTSAEDLLTLPSASPALVSQECIACNGTSSTSFHFLHFLTSPTLSVSLTLVSPHSRISIPSYVTLIVPYPSRPVASFTPRVVTRDIPSPELILIDAFCACVL